jgi:hypothetical protein
MNHKMAAPSTMRASVRTLTRTHPRQTVDRMLMAATLVLATVTVTALVFTSGRPRQLLGAVLLALMGVLVLALSRPPSTKERADAESDDETPLADERATAELVDRGVRRLAVYLERHAQFAEYLEQQHSRSPAKTARRRRRGRPGQGR